MRAARKILNRSKSAGFRLDRQQVVWCLHPGRARPGLIEASPSEAGRRRLTRRIRGARAPASLKRCLDSELQPFRGRIRGARAPASLKLLDAIGFLTEFEVHPGRARPGLIEALRVARWRVPAASHPGRARPGLIEAFERVRLPTA